VYVTSFGGHGVYSAPVTGGVANLVAKAEWPTYVAVDASHVYWTDLSTNQVPGSVGRVPLAGGTAELLATPLDRPNSSALNDRRRCDARLLDSGSEVRQTRAEVITDVVERASLSASSDRPSPCSTSRPPSRTP
jgi:hypothetical protein